MLDTSFLRPFSPCCINTVSGLSSALFFHPLLRFVASVVFFLSLRGLFSFFTQHVKQSCAFSLSLYVSCSLHWLRLLQWGCCCPVSTEEHQLLRQNICSQDDLPGRGIAVSYRLSWTWLPTKCWVYSKHQFLSTPPLGSRCTWGK